MNESMQRIGDRERQYVDQVLAGQFRASSGHAMATRLEEAFSRIFGTRYAVSFVNGTATLHAALAAAGIGPGDEVIVPPLTMASTAMAVCHAGALPVFADIDPKTWTLDPASVEERITSRTRGVIPVAIYGLAPDLDAIMGLARQRELFVLEDDAQCFLGTWKGKTVGTIGHAASFSFQSSKHMASGEGGMVITDDADLALAVRRFNSLGYRAVGAGKGAITREDIQDPGYLRHDSIGWNYRMPELCAAVALAQAERLEELVAARIQAANLFHEAVAGCSWLVPQHVPEDCRHTYWTYAVRLAGDAPATWHEFRKKFMASGGDGFYGAWQLTYLEPAFAGKRFADHQSQIFQSGLCPAAENLQPGLMQFQTNRLDDDAAADQADALAKTIDFFNK